MKLLSFVIPCYRSEKTIVGVIDEIKKILLQRNEYEYEIILINDCSPDAVYSVIQKLANSDKKIKVVNLARNVGKHGAILAGYAFVKGDYVVNLDDDGQCPITELWNLLEPLEKDEADVTTAQYTKKEEGLLKRIGSNLNLWISGIMLDKPKNLRFENFSIIKRYVCDEVIKYSNPYPYLEGLIIRTTRRIVTVPMKQRNRLDDNKSGFTLAKGVSLFINGFTSFSVKPLRIASVIGLLFAVVGFGYTVFIIIHKLVNHNVLLGYSSIMAVLLISFGLIMLMLGIIGEYVGRIFISLNNSPQYVVKNTINLDEMKII